MALKQLILNKQIKERSSEIDKLLSQRSDLEKNKKMTWNERWKKPRQMKKFQLSVIQLMT